MSVRTNCAAGVTLLCATLAFPAPGRAQAKGGGGAAQPAARPAPAGNRGATPAAAAAPAAQPRPAREAPSRTTGDAAASPGRPAGGGRSLVVERPAAPTPEQCDAGRAGPRDWRRDWRDGGAIYGPLGGRYQGVWNPYGYVASPYAPWYGAYDDDATRPAAWRNPPAAPPVAANPPDPAPRPAEPDPQAARTVMLQARDRVEAEVYASPEWAAANIELTSAQAALDAEAARVRQSLSEQADYRAAKAQKEAADAAVSSLRVTGTAADPASVTPAAERKLSAAKRLTELESAALSADPQWAAARARQQAAAARRNALLAGIPGRVQNDPAWRAAADQLNAGDNR